MKKILVVLLAVFLFAGCSCSLNDNKPEEAIETFFEKYRAKDDDIITQLKDTIDNEDLTDDAKEKYQELMVLKAEEELKNNQEKFNDEEGNFSEEKYMEYKIEKMSEVTETTTHTIDLSLTKENGMWKVNQLSSDDISKLHGLY